MSSPAEKLSSSSPHKEVNQAKSSVKLSESAPPPSVIVLPRSSGLAPMIAPNFRTLLDSVETPRPRPAFMIFFLLVLNLLIASSLKIVQIVTKLAVPVAKVVIYYLGVGIVVAGVLALITLTFRVLFTTSTSSNPIDKDLMSE